MSTPTGIEAHYPITPTVPVQDYLGAWFHADKVWWHARTSTGRLIVTVTALGDHNNRTWYTAHDVIPDWIPAPPEWWDAQVRAMHDALAVTS